MLWFEWGQIGKLMLLIPTVPPPEPKLKPYIPAPLTHPPVLGQPSLPELSAIATAPLVPTNSCRLRCFSENVVGDSCFSLPEYQHHKKVKTLRLYTHNIMTVFL